MSSEKCEPYGWAMGCFSGVIHAKMTAKYWERMSYCLHSHQTTAASSSCYLVVLVTELNKSYHILFSPQCVNIPLKLWGLISTSELAFSDTRGQLQESVSISPFHSASMWSFNLMTWQDNSGEAIISQMSAKGYCSQMQQKHGYSDTRQSIHLSWLTLKQLGHLKMQFQFLLHCCLQLIFLWILGSMLNRNSQGNQYSTSGD